MLSKFIYGNLSIVGILIASLCSFIICIGVNKWRIINLRAIIVYVSLILFFAFILILTKGRGGLVGFITSLCLLYYKHHHSKFSKIKTLLLFAMLLAMGFYIFIMKKDSSQGRLLIYKVSAAIFQENWLWGVGFGNFKMQYNLHQANYFFSHNIDGKEALLADNTFYAFNDPWQLLIEIGIIRFVCVLMMGILVIKVCKRYSVHVEKRKASIFYGASSALLCIIVASLF